MSNKRDPEKRRKFLEKQGLTRVPNGYQVDHIIALEDGGRDSVANMQLLTKANHEKKTARENRTRSKKKKLD